MPIVRITRFQHVSGKRRFPARVESVLLEAEFDHRDANIEREKNVKKLIEKWNKRINVALMEALKAEGIDPEEVIFQTEIVK